MADHGPTTTLDECLSLWRVLESAALTRVGIEAAAGGSGGDLHDLCTVVEALGRHGVSVPVELMVADWASSRVGAAAASPATLTVLESAPPTVRKGATWTMTGAMRSVPWARAVPTLIAGVRDGESGTLFAIPLHHPTVRVEPRDNLAGEPLDDVVLERTPLTRLPGRPNLDQLADGLELLRLALLHGACQGTVELTKTHVAQRHQSGKPLAAIPAVAANVATLRVHLVQAKAALERAADVVVTDLVTDQGDDGPSRMRLVAALAAARAVLAAASTEIAHIAHQLHGAIGTTWEYQLHHLTRRIWSWRDYGTSAHAAQTLLGRLAVAEGEDVVWTQLTR